MMLLWLGGLRGSRRCRGGIPRRHHSRSQRYDESMILDVAAFGLTLFLIILLGG
jgi:hypothetical protein